MAFTRLPVLERLKPTRRELLRDVCVVAIQHLLETTGSLVEALLAAGCAPGNLHILGKLYSTNAEVVGRLRRLGVNVHSSSQCFRWGGFDEQLTLDAREMWHRVLGSIDDTGIRRVVILDDGGFAAATAPSTLIARIPTIAIEQTSSGLRRSHAERLPVIAVAASAAKTLLEPALIRDAVFLRALAEAPRRASAMGVVGLGHIGRSIADGLIAAGHQVLGFDHAESACHPHEQLERCESVGEVLQRTDVVWGCAGTDIFSIEPSAVLTHRARLISCSSGDYEFRKLLATLNDMPTMDRVCRTDDLLVRVNGHPVFIQRGGFPVNFDGSAESVPANDIQITRGLLFAGVLQAVGDLPDRGLVALSSTAQRIAVEAWLRAHPIARGRYAPSLIAGFSDDGWIAERSVSAMPLRIVPSAAAR